ncbi:hypothetical protein [uncultured Bacteroides sp.]|uniref:hypothetical protein n=1 Tax=uncultured Bacteroides sp. TaxID=162156 RepID=UPI002608534A|nr:hypothetical protein [uncultured Bacteroides sp.]
MVKHYEPKRADALCRACIFLFLLLFAIGCEEDKEPALYMPTLATNTATGQSRFGATIQGTVTPHEGSSAEYTVGFLYSTSASLANPQEIEATPGEGNNYTATLQGLQPGQTYYYCIFARSGDAMVKGKTSNFDTDAATRPAVSVVTTADITEESVQLQAEVTDNGGYEPDIRGFVYAPYIENGPDLNINDDETIVAFGQDFTATLSGLKPNTTYSVRAYATSGAGTGYGEPVQFTTTASKIPIVIANGQGSLGDVPVSAAAYTAVLTGAVTADHGLAVSEVGFCWSAESRQPTVEQSQSVKLDGASAKRFSATIEGLMANTRYYVRAYAKNEKGTGYSATVEFTSDTEQVVSLTQAMVTAFTSSTATISAQMTSTEKTKILEKGVCYGTAMNPDVNGTKVKDEGTDTKLLTATLTGLTEGQVYHARAYAVTRDGTFYSGDVQFQTETTYAPTLTTITVYDKTETGVKVRASVATNGGLDITEKGIVYSSTEAEPTLENGTKAVATGEGNDISVTLSNLKGGTTYFARAYATNAKGTGYGVVGEFVTAQHTVPVVGSLNVSSIGDDNAQASAFLSDIGGEGEVISERGFVLSVGSEPTVEGCDFKIVSTATTEEFTAKLTKLSYSTLYNIRAYAINKVGAGYSQMLQFETGHSTTPSLGELKCVKAEAHSLQLEFPVTNNGGATLTEYGVMLDNTQDVKGKLDGNKVTLTLTSLKENTSYTVRGYAANKNGKVWTNTEYFNTAKLPPSGGDNPLPGDDDGMKKPSVGYTSVSEIYATSAWVSASINDDGKSAITEQGFLWAEGEGDELTVDNATKIVMSLGKNSMRTKLTNLKGKTRYRVRAYAINAKGVGYGGQQWFTTESADKPEPGEGDNPTPGVD